MSSNAPPYWPDDASHAPRVALVGSPETESLLDPFTGRFTVRRCDRLADLVSALVSQPLDLVLLDCRQSVPGSPWLEVVRAERLVATLAVGRPPDRRSIPSWLESHWCPWPVPREAFYRLLISLSRKTAWARAFLRQDRELRELRDREDRAAEVASVLHEVNNPLDAVRRYTALAAEETAELETRRFLDLARLGLERMRETLRELARDAHAARPRIEMGSLHEIIREAAVLSDVASDGLVIETTIEGGPWHAPTAVTLVLINLLLNAKQASPPNGVVRIEVAPRGDRLAVSVHDRGEGFGELFKDELFRPWSTTADADEGRGLGLHAARLAVERLGGTLDAHSDGAGLGACFTLEIPVSRKPTPAPLPIAPESRP